MRANFVSTLDGAATGADGLSRSINDPADQKVFGLLRALSDVVLVGSGTVAAEHYRAMSLTDDQRAVRATTGRSWCAHPGDREPFADLPEHQLAPGEGRVIVLHPSECDDAQAGGVAAGARADNVIEAGDGWVDPARAVEVLAERGLAPGARARAVRR